MGFPLRSNIFKAGTKEQKYFNSFPIQVAILFSPEDKEFSDVFRDLFLHFDRLTGEHVAFFAVIDPPHDWFQEAQKRSWWQEYQNSIGVSGYSLDKDRALSQELTRLFQVSWHELPVLVISTNLWNAELIVVPTSAFHIERQLTFLTEIAKEWGRPTIDHIIQAFEDELGDPVRFYPPSNERRYRISRVYDVLDTFNPYYKDRYQIHQRYWGYVRREMRTVNAILNNIRPSDPRDQRMEHIQEDSISDDTLIGNAYAEISGLLVSPATVAAKARKIIFERPQINYREMLEEEAANQIDTALLNGQFLETMIQYRMRDIGVVDFSGGAQGAWKAFELEINLSLIQAARKARTIRMPQFFALYVPGFPKIKSRVLTGTTKGHEIYKDINLKDSYRAHTGRHKLLSLGESWYVTIAMHNNRNEDFNNVIENCGASLTQRFMTDWQRINQIRNPASHTEPLNFQDYQEIINIILVGGMLEPLMLVKENLRQ